VLIPAEGATIFRVEQRRLLSSDGLGIVEEEVVFTAPLRVLFWKTWARTRVHQRIDTRDPQLTKVYFRLIASVRTLQAGFIVPSNGLVDVHIHNFDAPNPYSAGAF
jgi:hypothetical protein